MNILKNLVLSLFLLAVKTSTTAAEEEWYSLGNYIEEEGYGFRAGHAVANSADGMIIAVASPYYSPEAEAEQDGENDDELPEGSEETPKGLRLGRVVVYEFDKDTDEWSKLGAPILGDVGEELGTSIDMSTNGEVIAIGSKADSGDLKESGAVKVYILNRLTGTPRWIQKGKTIPGEDALDHFGASVALHDDGKIVVVGSPGADVLPDKPQAGKVGVYLYNDSTEEWDQLENVIDGSYAMGKFGTSVAVSEEGLIAGGGPDANDKKGYVHIYRYNLNETDFWLDEGQVLHGETAGDQFGQSLALSVSGKHVVVGAPFQKVDDKKRAGVVKVFEEKEFNDGNKIWVQVGDKINGLSEGEEFGTSVDISEDGLAIAAGAPLSSHDDKRESGHISVYHDMSEGINDPDWILRHAEIVGKKPYSHQGSSVALSGDGYEVIGGAPTEGYVSVFMLARTAPPTPAPTDYNPYDANEKEEGGRHRRSGFATFILVIFIISLVIASAFLVFKGVLYYRNKRSFTQAPNTDLELRNVERSEPGADAGVV